LEQWLKAAQKQGKDRTSNCHILCHCEPHEYEKEDIQDHDTWQTRLCIAKDQAFERWREKEKDKPHRKHLSQRTGNAPVF
jgi:hypothetical protein